jgi:uncharacterized protein YbjT (DUF2867 family)
VRSTQFFDFLGGIADAGTSGTAIRLSPVPVQPIASDDVADALVELVLAAPVNGTVEIAGPERLPLAELVRQFLKVKKDPRSVVEDVEARYFGALLNDRTLVPGDNPRLGRTHFDGWLGQQRIAA